MPAASPAKSSLYNIGAALLGLILAAQLIHVSRATSMTWDEGHHLYDGYNTWKNFDYRLNPEVPPLVKLISVLPLLHANLYVSPNQEREEQTEAYLDGRAFLLTNGYDRILIPARMACMIFTLALALLLYAATREIFSPLAALFALALFAFDPNFLAHGALVTTDVPCACMMLASIYAWYRYCKRPTALRLFLVALAIGLGVVAKFTGIFFWPMLLLLAVGEAIQRRSLRLFGQRLAALFAVAAVAYVILWSFYGFRYVPAPNGRDTNPPFAEYLQKVPRPADAAHLELVAKHHLLPEAYIFGLANTKITENADTSYFFGHVHRHGTWLYFPPPSSSKPRCLCSSCSASCPSRAGALDGATAPSTSPSSCFPSPSTWLSR